MSKVQISHVIDSGKGKIGGLIILALVLLLTPILIITIAGVAVIGAAGIGGVQSAQMENNEKMGGDGGNGCSTTVSGQTGSSNAGTSTDQDINSNVRTIIGVGKGLGISDVGIKIALVTAQKESSLRNLANDGVHGSEDDAGQWPAEGADHYLNIAKKSMEKPNGGKERTRLRRHLPAASGLLVARLLRRHRQAHHHDDDSSVPGHRLLHRHSRRRRS